jgi:hypothetical protein
MSCLPETQGSLQKKRTGGESKTRPRLKFLVRVLELKEGIAWRHLKLD